MSTSTLERPVSTTTDDDDLMHIVCEFCWRQFCDGDRCPDDDLEPYGEYPNDCIVCEDLDAVVSLCPHCGADLGPDTS